MPSGQSQQKRAPLSARSLICCARSAALLALLACIAGRAARADEFAVLLFSKTAEFRHASIPAGIAAIRDMGEAHGFRVDATEDATAFTGENLARYQAVVFFNTTGNVLDDKQQAAFESYVRKGHGFVGIHSATDTEYDWPWYGALVGVYFRRHPAIQRATLFVDRSHLSTAHLPVRWQRTDEWYNFRQELDPDVQVLIRLDEGSYSGGSMGANHPISWCHEFDGGRAWYTALGHQPEAYAEPLFLEHLLGGIRWAAGVASTQDPS
jgi:cytochrome c